MVFIGLTQEQVKQLENEVVPKRARLQLIRLLRGSVSCDDTNLTIARTNNVLNICQHVLGRPTSIIEKDGNGDYFFVDIGWIRSEFECVFRRPDTAELIEILADLIQNAWLDCNEVNNILSSNGCEFCFTGHYMSEVSVEITPVESIEEEAEFEIQNIRTLLNRMDMALSSTDYPGVLHASASILETLAKDTLASPTILDQSLGAFFAKYRANSHLPAPVLDYIHAIYNRRGTEPLAGHGSVTPPTITETEAVVISEMTKAFLRIERKLSSVCINLSSSPRATP